MLTAYVAEASRLAPAAIDPDAPAPPEHLVWLDLYEPSQAEEDAVERWLHLDVPTREEMREIEMSSRLTQQDGAVTMTALMLSHAETDHPELSDVTFILGKGVLVTVRYADPKPFRLYVRRAAKEGLAGGRADEVYAGLMDAAVDRLADILERIGSDSDALFRLVFASRVERPMHNRDFNEVLRRIGRIEDVSSKTRESLVTLGRVLSFIIGGGARVPLSKEARDRLETALRDANQLADHAAYQANKIAFLLDATIGLIGVEQNNIIKIFSVASVALMPPTLIASIYGMNFKHMPELDWPFGYPMALGLMVASAILPYLYFRRKGWL